MRCLITAILAIIYFQTGLESTWPVREESPKLPAHGIQPDMKLVHNVQRATARIKRATDSSIGKFVQQLWTVDVNRFTAPQEFKISLKGPKLFQRMNGTALAKLPYSKELLELSKLYNPRKGANEMANLHAKNNWSRRLVAKLFQTRALKMTYDFLKKAGQVGTTFQNQFHDLWFYLYKSNRNSRHPDTCGFEHIMLGEKDVRAGKASGMHSWRRYYQMETSGAFKLHSARYATGNRLFAKVSFTWDGRYYKDISSIFLGSSLEFEMALYTMCALLRPKTSQRCRFRLAGSNIEMKTFQARKRKLVLLGGYPRV